MIPSTSCRALICSCCIVEGATGDGVDIRSLPTSEETKSTRTEAARGRHQVDDVFFGEVGTGEVYDNSCANQRSILDSNEGLYLREEILLAGRLRRAEDADPDSASLVFSVSHADSLDEPKLASSSPAS